MRRLALSITALSALAMFGLDNPTANAAGPYSFGIHIGGASVHVGHGRAVHHGRYGYPRGPHVVHRHPHVYGGRAYCNPHHGHNYYDFRHSSRFDYHPPRVIRHGSHFDVIPGHYDFYRGSHFHYHR